MAKAIVIVLIIGLGLSVAIAYAGVEPFATYKDLVSNKITTFISQDIPQTDNQTPIVEPPSAKPPSQLTTTKPTINILELEEEIHSLVNTERINNGISRLEYDTKLADIAKAHSEDMALRDYFSHNTLGIYSQGPTERAKAAGYNCYKDFGSYYVDGIAENIYQNWLYSSITYYGEAATYNWYTQDEIAISTVAGWMDSPGHRQNILDSSYSKEGIGVAISTDNKVLITQDFW